MFPGQDEKASPGQGAADRYIYGCGTGAGSAGIPESGSGGPEDSRASDADPAGG